MNMKNCLSVAIAHLVAISSFAAPRPADTLNYTITPVVVDGALKRLDVDLAFRGDQTGRGTLDLPDQWAQAQSLWRGIQDLTVTGAQLDGTPGPKRRLTYKPGAQIHAHYHLDLSDTDPTWNHIKGEPVLRPTWFMVHGEALLATPVIQARAPTIRVRWGAHPAGWTLASDLEHNGGKVKNLDELSTSVLVGATQATEVRKTVDGATLRVVALGSWPFRIEDFAAVAARVITAENRLWRDRSREFLITISSLGQVPGGNGRSTTGTGKGDGFTI
jgi:predicted metalloprotease with PDZ domain